MTRSALSGWEEKVLLASSPLVPESIGGGVLVATPATPKRRPLPLAATVVAAAAIIVFAVIALVVLFPHEALAKTYDSAWTVENNGGATLVDNGTADITQTVSGLQPGDSAAFTITLWENTTSAANWYMANEVLTSMEETFAEANASGGSYSYLLKYISPSGEEKVLLTNDTVSGDASTGSTDGLKDATSGMEDYFFLDELAAGAKAEVHLEVALDGETHGNTYFDSAAKLMMKFAVEPVDNAGSNGNPGNSANNTSSTNDDSKNSNTKKDTKDESVLDKLAKTGDWIPLALITVAALVACGVMASSVARRRVSSHHKEGGAQ